MTRYAISIGLSAMLAGLAFFTFWRVHVVGDSDLGALVPRMEAQASIWDAQHVPASARLFNLVLSDADSGSDPLAVPEEPGVPGRTFAWINRTYLPRQAVAPSAFAKAFSGEPNTIDWTSEGLATASESQMAREVAKTIEIAHDAGAQLNIVAQGSSVEPVIKALESLEGVQRKGSPVGANRVVLVGVDRPRLKSISAHGLRRLGNVKELANIWVPKEDFNKKAMLQVDGGGEVGTISVEDVWPYLAGHSYLLAELLPLVRQLVSRVEALEQVVSRQKQVVREAAAVRQQQAATAQPAQAPAATTYQVRDHLDSVHQKTEGGGDFLSMIKGGEPYSEAARQQASPQQQASSGSYDWARHDRECGQCCAGVGGVWRRGSYDDNAWQACSNQQVCQAAAGCCQGADWPNNWASMPSCRAANRFKFGIGYGSRFRCAR